MLPVNRIAAFFTPDPPDPPESWGDSVLAGANAAEYRVTIRDGVPAIIYRLEGVVSGPTPELFELLDILEVIKKG